MRFKVGDRIVATDFTGVSGAFLEEGVVYTVQHVVLYEKKSETDRGRVLMKISGSPAVEANGREFYSDRFKSAHNWTDNELWEVPV